ncbi:hypothetical protein B0H14DRAFT_3741770 [Mycena olivaceomarginata]|nr:hypothetical protein B0H14DRAFT_3741770 [Mycena olivaceomarginata]
MVFPGKAVKTLCEIWWPQCILTSPESRHSFSITNGVRPQREEEFIFHRESSSFLDGFSQDAVDKSPRKSIVYFVYNVLRRSRTSGPVLQIALCYLEAIRYEVPNLIERDKYGESTGLEPWCRVTPATIAELQIEAQLSGSLKDDMTARACQEAIKTTARMPWEKQGCVGTTVHRRTIQSPLLCPMRTFLAAVILANKLTHDICYFNHAWAQLVGLSVREISRCERALGEKLDWRLWVGKPVAPSQGAAVVG